MKPILAVAALNFKQGIKEKIFYGVVFFYIFLLAIAILLGALSIGETQKVMRSAGITGIELSSLLLVTFSLTMGYYREKDARILEVYLSYFSRANYMLGKLLGYLLISVFYLTISSFGWAIILILYEAFSLKIFAAVYVLFLKLAVVITINLTFCVLLSSPILTLLMTLSLYYASEMCYQAVQAAVIHGERLRYLAVKFVYYLLPNMNKLDIKSSIVYNQIPGIEYFLGSTLYAFCYVGIIAFIIVSVFSKKECI